jgi:Thymidine kinase
LFEGSKRLIELAESIHEIKTVCKCGAKASYNTRLDSEGRIVTKREQIMIGGNDRYRPLCKRCYEELRMREINFQHE